VKKLHKMVQRLANKAIRIDLIIKNLSNLHKMDEFKFKLYFATSQAKKNTLEKKKKKKLHSYNRDFLDPAEIDE